MSNHDIRRRLEERGDAEQAKDLLRRSFDRHADEQREQHERIRAERVRRIWEEASNASRED